MGAPSCYCLSLSPRLTQASKKERKKGEGERGRPGQRENKGNEERHGMVQAGPAWVDHGGPGETRREEKKENPSRPRERKGEEEGGRGEKRKTDPETTAPESRERRKNKNSLI